LAAEKFYDSKFWKPIMLLTKQIKVERHSKDKSSVVKKVGEYLAEGKAIGVFPEGTRSRTGQIQKPYVGVSRFAINESALVIPIGIYGAFEILPPQRRFPKFTKCTINIGEPINPKEYLSQFSDKNGVTHLSVEEILTHHIMSRIAELAGKKYVHGNIKLI